MGTICSTVLATWSQPTAKPRLRPRGCSGSRPGPAANGLVIRPNDPTEASANDLRLVTAPKS